MRWFVATLIAGCAMTGSASAEDIQVRTGGSMEQRAADRAVCDAWAGLMVRSDPLPGVSDSQRYQLTNQYGALPAAVGEIIGGAIAGRINRSVEKARNERACMTGLGYVNLELTREEARARNAGRDEAAKDQWDAEFMRSHATGRLALITDAAPEFSIPAHGQWMGSAVRLDPDSLTVADSLAADRVVIRAKAAPRATAVMGRTLTIRGDFQSTLTVAAGTRLHQLAPSRSVLAYGAEVTWCGRASLAQPGSVRELTYCFQPRPALAGPNRGYMVYGLDQPAEALGVPLAAEMFSQNRAAKIPLLSLNGPLGLERDTAPPQYRFEVTLRATFVEDLIVLLEGAVLNQPREYSWMIIAPRQGQSAVLPLWDRRLTLGLNGNTITSFEMGSGDGRGWLDVYGYGLAESDMRVLVPEVPADVLARSSLVEHGYLSLSEPRAAP